LYRTAHNLITDSYRRPPPLPLDETLQADDSADPAQVAPAHWAEARARAALWQLTAEQRLVMTLKYFEGLSNDEVASALGKPVGAVKSLHHRALAALRRVLSAEAETVKVTP
jgi:RNA polymerase sigma-70 factor (ECF subfamily)